MQKLGWKSDKGTRAAQETRPERRGRSSAVPGSSGRGGAGERGVRSECALGSCAQPPGHSPCTTFITQSPPCGEGPSPGAEPAPGRRGAVGPARRRIKRINRGGAAGRIRLTLQKGTHGRTDPSPPCSGTGAGLSHPERQESPAAGAGKGLVPLLQLQLLREVLGHLCQW